MRLEAVFAASGFVMVFSGVWLQVSLPMALIVGGSLLLLATIKRVRP